MLNDLIGQSVSELVQNCDTLEDIRCMGVPAIQPLSLWWAEQMKTLPCSAQNKDLIGTLFSRTSGRFSDNVKVNGLHHCDREGERELQRGQSGDRLSLLRGEG